MRALRATPALAIIALGLSFARPSHADATDVCISESEAGQRLLLERHFVESRQHLVACGRSQCPAVVLRDCTERLRQAEASMASVVLFAKRVDGSDVSDVRVFVDNASTPYTPTGAAYELNPGVHSFRFERAGGARVVRQLTIAEGSRLQSVVATFDADPASPVEPSPSSAWSPRKTLSFVVGGVGVLGLAAGAVFGILASSRWSQEQSDCGGSTTRCSHFANALNDYNAANTFGTVSNITLPVGGALLVAGAVLFFTAPPSGAFQGATLQLAPLVAPNEGGFVFGGTL